MSLITSHWIQSLDRQTLQLELEENWLQVGNHFESWQENGKKSLRYKKMDLIIASRTEADEDSEKCVANKDKSAFTY